MDERRTRGVQASRPSKNGHGMFIISICYFSIRITGLVTEYHIGYSGLILSLLSTGFKGQGQPES
jgi:hypothetical protein